MRGWMFLLLGVAGVAHADTFYLESAPSANREPAEAVARAATAQGVDGRIVRLYAADVGWQFLFRSEEETDDGALRPAAATMSAISGTQVQVIRLHDGEATVVPPEPPPPASAVKTARPAATPPSTTPKPPDASLDAQEILRRVVRAHGGAAPRAMDDVDHLVFRYDREQSDRQVTHLYARRGDDVYLQVEVKSGEGVSSRAGCVGSAAWSDTGAKALDPARVREQIGRFGPARVLSIAGLFAAGMPTDTVYQQMVVVPAPRSLGKQAVALSWPGDRVTGPMQVVVDTATWRIREVAWGADGHRVRWVFNAYQERDDGGIHPTEIDVYEGEARIDHVLVRELDLDPTLLPEWFPVR